MFIQMLMKLLEFVCTHRHTDIMPSLPVIVCRDVALKSQEPTLKYGALGLHQLTLGCGSVRLHQPIIIYGG
jgi:hypothetical protein